MAIVKVQSITGNGATIALNGVGAGNELFFPNSYTRPTTGATEATPTDTNGTFVAARNDVPVVFNTSDDVGATIWYQENTASGTHTVTPQANASHHGTLAEFSGMATSGSLDATVASQKNNAGNQSSQATGTTGATAQADELSLVCFSIASGGGTAIVQTDPITNYTTLQKIDDTVNDFGVFQAYQILTSTGTQSATDNWTNQATPEASIGCIATFKAAAAVGGGSGAVVGPFHLAGPSLGPEIRRMALPQRYPDTIPPSLGETTPLWVGPSILERPGVARRRLPQQFPDTIIPPPSPGGPTVGRVARGPGGMGPSRRRQIAQLFADTVIVLAALAGNVVLAGEIPSLTTALQPTEGQVIIAGNAPSITIGTILQPAEGQVIIGGNAPSLTESLGPTEGAVVIGGNAPSLTEQLQAVDGVVIIGGNVPAVSQSGPGVLTPTEAPLVIGGSAPNILFALAPTEGNISIDGNTPDFGPPPAGAGGSSARHPHRARIVWEKPDKRKPPTFIDKLGEPVDLLAKTLAPETVASIIKAEADPRVAQALKSRVPDPAPLAPLSISPEPDDEDDDLLLLS